MPYLVIEYSFNPPLPDEMNQQAFAALKPCLEMRGIRRLRSYVSTDRNWGICEYEAADAESVREAYRSAKIPYAKIHLADLFEFGPAKLGGAG
jgi:hypothetical protein